MSTLSLADFDYELPEELIAQRPTARREDARLLVLGRQGEVAHRGIPDLAHILPAGALLVVNDTKVFPARLRLRRHSGGAVEVLLVEPLAGQGKWLAMTRSSKRLKAGEELFAEGIEGPQVAVEQRHPDGKATVVLLNEELPEQMGEVPLPPYIRRRADEADTERYQTVFARTRGSVAAPTAGLHLTESLFAALAQRDINVARVTLHVGPGTFLPVRVDDPKQHRMHEERYSVDQRAAESVSSAKREGRPVVAVGTTSVRTLEATGGRAGSGRTDIFIYPGYRFRVVDALLTNFHLPRSTLLMLVSALAGRERILAAYREAVAARYRFFSYGDAMLIL